VLSQLGLKVQHALRAFTAKDRKAIKLTAENYPISEYYKTDEVLTSLGIGEALVSALNEKGIPTPLAVTMLRAPMSRMDILEDHELKNLVDDSKLVKKYNEEIDRESAYELLNKKIEIADLEEAKEKAKQEREETSRTSSRSRSSRTRQSTLVKTLTSPTVIRSVLGILGKMMR
jgi:predicted flap endonuclease-1-like 5' DNA nuclease